MKETQIFVATPMYGGQCTGLFMQSMLQCTNIMASAGMGMAFTCMLNESLIQRARNALAHQFLKNDQFSHLMFIDSDIQFNPHDIVKMVQADVDVICGIYPKKEINWVQVKAAVERGVPVEQLKHYTGSHVVNLVDYSSTTTVPIDKPVEIWNGGTGFMLIKRHVLANMSQLVPSYNNDVLDLSGNLSMDVIAELFPVFIDPDSNRLLSEDYGFCKKVRDAGYKVYAAPWARLGHYGTYLFEGQLLPAP
jgi:hypothetical protein